MALQGEYAPSTSDWAREQAERYEASGGTEAATLRGMPIIVVTTVGASTGKLRKTALMRVEHGGKYLLVGSKGGAPKHPAWVFNVRANPLVELQDGAVKRAYRAVEAAGAEREEWWPRAVEAYPPYADYQKKTDRLIPLFVLTPVEEQLEGQPEE
ncbi:nitroreductase family deazaflavin-dependent oxidoreductase [Ruicaihuangia caeni]|uniref:Nitroreductase family deazaflavin-dependent oxidoreductase n=1 Tax=Ruicaihuangia caeni TaxID=3042517 RepID=A0AAW6TA62_9MICO|nr:nitroreductase family deazaflavin-dependent oxidoreductase [Klugiella sp. YN-L-19]MDI2098950.1 nitroreductase family deazaflavin-dependent oxidoreductase [Klugiella sp. YN-L-19]